MWITLCVYMKRCTIVSPVTDGSSDTTSSALVDSLDFLESENNNSSEMNEHSEVEKRVFRHQHWRHLPVLDASRKSHSCLSKLHRRIACIVAQGLPFLHHP